MKVQRRLAAQILKVGESRVWLDPSKREDIEKAITKGDIRRLIKKGFIKTLPAKVKRVKERGKRRGVGSKKGKKYAIVKRKRRWINTIRPLRRMLKELKDQKKIDNQTYRKLRRLIKAGMFRSRAHLKIYLEQHGILKER